MQVFCACKPDWLERLEKAGGRDAFWFCVWSNGRPARENRAKYLYCLNSQYRVPSL
jgi:hypothetical protein